MRIVRAAPEHLDDCVDAVTRSGIGEVYFTDPDATRRRLAAAVESGGMWVALDGNSRAAGLAWISDAGAFGSFPYLRLIVVREDIRGQGIGSALLEFFEAQGFARMSKVFLLVSDFNTRAQGFYKRRGYVQVGFIPDMFIHGVAEHIMMKLRPEVL